MKSLCAILCSEDRYQNIASTSSWPTESYMAMLQHEQLLYSEALEELALAPNLTVLMQE